MTSSKIALNIKRFYIIITLLRGFPLYPVLYIHVVYATYALERQPLFGTVTYDLEQYTLIKWIICFYNKHIRLVNYTPFC